MLGRVFHRASVLISALLLLSLSANQASAQYQTYGEAINDLLGTGLSSNTDPSCKLTTNNAPDVPGLSDALDRHCNQDFPMVGGGASLGGSLFGFGSTRTISQFVTRRSSSGSSQSSQNLNFGADNGLEAFLFGQPQAPQPMQLGFRQETSPSQKGFSVNGSLDLAGDTPSGMVAFTDGSSSLFATFEYERQDRDSTSHQTGYEADTFTGMVGAAFRVTQSTIFGFNAYYGRTNGDLNASTPNVINFDDDPDTLAASSGAVVQRLCGELPDGKLASNEWGGAVFAMLKGQNGTFLNAEAGAASIDSKTTQGLCLSEANNNGDVEDIHRGVINGRPEGYRIDAKLRGGYDITSSGFVTGPRLGVDYKWTKIDAFSETETAFGANSGTGGATGVRGDVYNTTGAALAYNEQDFGSLQTRLGWVIAAPMQINDSVVTPFAEVTYIHEFLNDQRNIVAHFVGDTRADPLDFSFKNDKPDRDFFELASGLSMNFANGATGSIGGRAILGNSLYESYAIQGSVAIPF